jgi:lysophospholipase L1-like esterase
VAEAAQPDAAPDGTSAASPQRGRNQEIRKGAWVLHIGDSFVHASLQQNLGPRFRATGTAYVVDATTATYTTTWSADPDLDHWLARRPALVLVTLGANEVDLTVPEEHGGAIAHIARKIHDAGASCVWITPPLWKKDTGILQVIHDRCAPCIFFDSDAVLGGLRDDERQRDRIHPNSKGGARWTEALWGWLQEHLDRANGNWSLVPFELRGSSSS